MRERITEARLRSLAEAAAGENVTGTLYEPDSEDVLGLVAEVRRLRGLIDRFVHEGLPLITVQRAGERDDATAALTAEAKAIRAEEAR